MIVERLERTLREHPLVSPRLATLRLAEEINTEFRNPCIFGGFLRNIVLGVKPRDCDVVFEGSKLNQLGILESVREAEIRLGIDDTTEWEFENILATGFSGNLVADSVGKYSPCTDTITALLMNSSGTLYTGGQRTLDDIDNRIFDLRFEGVEMWVKHRAKGRSYTSCLLGDLIRGLYFSYVLGIEHSTIAFFLSTNFDHFFTSLDANDQKARQSLWLKKTGGDPCYQDVLDRFGITSLKTLPK